MIKQFVSITAIAVALSGCVQNQSTRPTVYLSKEEVDRACILQAGSDLRRIAKLEATAGRALPWDPSQAGGRGNAMTDRVVELDATSVGMPVTYMFACLTNEQGRAFTSPLGRK
jgi:hypothetical protein